MSSPPLRLLFGIRSCNFGSGGRGWDSRALTAFLRVEIFDLMPIDVALIAV
jgi:hypothetical protein